MNKINFVNNSAPALNATNLNQLQSNIDNAKLENYSVNTNDSKFDDVKQIIGSAYADLKAYMITNRPIEDGNYIQNGAVHTVIGMEYANQTYGEQTSYCFEGIKFRKKANNIWGNWLKLCTLNSTQLDNVTTIGWYRVARIPYTGHPSTSLTLNISTNYSYSEPNGVLINVLTTWARSRIVQINSVKVGAMPITKVRTQYDSTNGVFYVDVYYNITTSNSIFVRNENTPFLGEILTPTLVSTQYTTQQELEIAYDFVTGSEIPTNEFLDGKQIFKKRIALGNLPNQTTKTVQTGLSNITVIKIEGMAKRTTDNTFYPLPFPQVPSTDNIAINVFGSSGAILINAATDRSSLVGYITLYYTKN